jgi:hypothetical protein
LYLLGATLIVLGVLSLLGTGLLALFGLTPGLLLFRMWPVAILGLGLLFVVPPFRVRDQRAMGAFFIPGFPILMVGAILMLASVFNAWGIWEYLWPMLIISLASGFLFAAIYTQLIWLLIPAIIIGLNGLAFQFCALTGLWNWWSVLWVVEPLAVGLSLLAVNVKVESQALFAAGLLFCGLAGFGVLLMITVLGVWWPVWLLAPALLILAGMLFLGLGMARHLAVSRAALE